jgi:hypothetical protein
VHPTKENKDYQRYSTKRDYKKRCDDIIKPSLLQNNREEKRLPRQVEGHLCQSLKE